MKKRLITALLAVAMILPNVAQASVYDFAAYNLGDNLLSGLSADDVYISAGHTDNAPASVLFDGHLNAAAGAGTRWCVDNGKQNGSYVEVSLDGYKTFDKFFIVSGFADSVYREPKQRLHSFSLYYWNDYEWIKIPVPMTVDTSKRIVQFEFEPVTACRIKLESNQEDAFRVQEIGITAPGKNFDIKSKRIAKPSASLDTITVNGRVYPHGENKVVYRYDIGSVFVSSKEVKNILPVTGEHDNAKGIVTFAYEDDTITFTAGQSKYVKNGVEFDMNAAAYTEGTSVYIPIRDMIHSVGLYMSWDGDAAEIKTYDPRTMLASDKGISPYEVEVNGERQLVFSGCNGDFIQYECADAEQDNISVKVRFDKPVVTADIRPLNLGIDAEISGDTVTFTGKCNDYLSVEINGELERPLFVFLLSPVERPSEGDPNVLFLDREDVYDIGNIEFYDGMTVYLGTNTVLYTELWINEAHDVKLIGNGMILSKTNQVNVTSYASDGIYIDGPMFPQLRNWHLPFYGCNDVTIKNVRELACTTGGDGMDLIGTSNVLIDHVFIKNQDDAIAVKTNKGYPTAKNIEIKNSIIWTMKSGNGIELGFEMNGFGEVSNVKCSNIDFIHRETDEGKNWRAALSIHHSGNALVENILYEDIRVEESDEAFLCLGYFFVPQYYYDGDTPPNDVVMRNITFRNVSYSGKNDAPSYFYNIMRQTIGAERMGVGTYLDRDNPDYKITMENVLFDNVTYRGVKIDSAETAKKCGFNIEPEVDIKFN